MSGTLARTLFAALVLLAATVAQAAVLSGNEATDDNVLTAGAESITRNAGGVFDFSDANGDGTANDPVSAGLNLAGYSLTQATLAADLKLSLNGAGLSGGGTISTTRANHVSTYSIIITNAGNISVGTLTARVAGTANGGGVSVTHTGSFSATTVAAWGTGSSRSSQGIKLVGDGTGALTVANIQAYAGRLLGNGVFIDGYTSVAVSTALDAYSGADTSWRQPSDVVIQNIGAGGVTLPYVKAYTNTSSINSGYHSSQVFITTAGAVTINGDVETWNTSSGSNRRAGNATITAGGRIEIAGTFDAHVGDYDINDHGWITLTSSAGDILLASLNLRNIEWIKFDAADDSTILGLITGTDGNAASGLVNIGTSLRTPSGQKVFYDPVFNPSLGGLSYTLADLSGTAGAGGLLTPIAVPEPATLALLGMGGLAMAGGAIRRRRRA